MTRDRELEDPRRRILVQALSLGLFSAIPSGLVLAQTYGTAPGKLPPGQSIYRIVGTARVNGNPADLKTAIKLGDTVTTDKGCEIVFVVGTQSMIVRGASELTIERSSDTSSLLMRGLRLVRGAVLCVLRNNPIEVRTSTATIGVRGTGFYSEVEEDQTYFCTCYGVTEVASVQDPGRKETIAANHHDRPVYILAGATGENIRNAPFINHTDQELALIETLVGREPPFVFPKGSYSAPRRSY